MEWADVNALRVQVLGAAFAVSIFFGWVVQRSQFCTMGAINDWLSMGDRTRFQVWMAAISTAALGLWAMHAMGWVDPQQSIYASERVLVLSALVGGAFFGFGMVLASGCGSKTLVRMGTGSLKALTVFVVMGVAAYATLRGITAVLRDRTLDQVFWSTDSSLLPVWLAGSWGGSPAAWGLGMAAALAVVVWAWAARNPDFWQAHHLWGALGIGGSVIAMWWVSGALGFVSEHPASLQPEFIATNSHRMESLTFTAPMAYTLHWLILFSDSANVLTLAVVSVAGVVVGAFVSAALQGSLRWEGFQGTQDTALHLIGATCMGFGGVTAMGCTVGQGLSGMSTLSVTSVLAMLGIVGGAVLGLKFQIWLLMRDD
jgi:uncharacterized membrane protein YedE/YeeE